MMAEKRRKRGEFATTCSLKFTVTISGASLSEPHLDELNVRNPYNIIIMVRTSPARSYDIYIMPVCARYIPVQDIY